MTAESPDLVAEALGRFASAEISEESLPGHAYGLVGAMLAQSHRDYQWTMNQLVEGYQRQNAEMSAELAAIRSAIEAALSGPWMPTPDYLLSCLYPSGERLERMTGGTE